MIKWQQPSIGKDEIEAVTEVLESGILTSGPKCAEFEKALSEVTDARYVAVVSSGTAALHCALQATEKYFGWKLNVALPTFSYIATANSVVFNGHTPFLVDSGKGTWNIDATKIPYPRCNILMPTDIGGLPCNYEQLEKSNMFMLEDAAEALGASYKGASCGSISDVTIFSFHPSKVITTGEGGAITTNNPELYDFIVQLRSQGNAKRKTFWEYKHDIIGFNYRMTEMQAAMGIVQLKKLQSFLEHRKKLVKLYKDLLGDIVLYQEVPKGSVHSNWLFAVLLKDWKMRESLCNYLLSGGIEVRTTWTPIHQQLPYVEYHSQSFPVAEDIARSIVSLPLNNKTSFDEVAYVAEEVRNFIRRRG